MLVLGRKILESIIIGGRIRLTVVKAGRNEVRLGIDAPDDIPVLRGELVEDGAARREPAPLQRRAEIAVPDQNAGPAGPAPPGAGPGTAPESSLPSPSKK